MLSNSFENGDTLAITKLDRLARSIPDLVRIIGTLEEKQATLRIMAMNLDTNTPTGRLLVNLVGSVAQFEREIMLERQREGVARQKRRGNIRDGSLLRGQKARMSSPNSKPIKGPRTLRNRSV